MTAPLTSSDDGPDACGVTISVLGPLRVNGDGSSLGPRDRVVLEVLVLRPGEVVSAERLADALWADVAPPTWNKVVQGCVVRLRKVLGADAIETSPAGYRLTTPPEEVDAHRFERMARRGMELLALGQYDRAAYVTGEALALWRGPALRELEDWDTGRIEANRLEELRLDAEEVRMEAALRAGQHREVLAEAQARAAEAPLRERRWALLALAQYQVGRQSDALRTLAPGTHDARRPSWASIQGRNWSRWSRRSCATTRRWSSPPHSPSRATSAPISVWCPTTSTTARGSSDASARSTRAWTGSARSAY